MSKFDSTFDYKLIYIFRINDLNHKDCLKIGEATIHTKKTPDQLLPNSHDLNYFARKRIDEYTSTAGIVYELLHTELALYKVNDPSSKNYGKIFAFRDFDVHSVLKRSNIRIKYFDTNKKQNEWFILDLETAKKAIKCVKEEKKSLTGEDISYTRNPIVFRPEQKEAIKKTVKRFKDSHRMLWNAKMRFGKTLSALQVVKEMEFKSTIIITHRPVVSEGWYDDFKKIFFDKPEYQFGSKVYGESSLNKLISLNKPFVYFASIQDLRGSAIVGGKFVKNNEIFNIEWDFIVVDEAHEGTQTNLGKSVMEELLKNNSNKVSKVLELSGTPFNLLSNIEEADIYTWDYIMEQEAKQEYFLNHFGDYNPYSELPKMNIFTYHLEKYITGFMDVEDKAFNFREFFRTWTGDVKKDGEYLPVNAKIGDFVHEKDIISFLDLICKESDSTNYPFSNDEYRDYFRHTFWVLPGVKEAKALSVLLKNHRIFRHFEIVNVAGDGDDDAIENDALQLVRNAISNHPENTFTITLSCGRLTTGVSIKEWTAVLMLSGSCETGAAQYLQTIFRVQTPANINGKIKENCYVFDFAPDRTLKMIAESIQLSSKTKSKNPIAEQQLAMFLNFCPVISVEGTNMKEFKVSMLLQELKKAYAERVIKNGFDDSRLYNDELLKLDEVDLEEFEKLKKAVGTSVAGSGVHDIEINSEGFNKEEYEKIEKAQKKPKKELTEEEKQLLEELKKKKENRNKAISILRAISIRMPLLIYGIEGDIDTEITIENFVDKVDDPSWKEFMPLDVDKIMFKKFIKYYDKDVFIACARKIRYISKTADELDPKDRVIKISELFDTFKNPDKETVLTPWKAVNMHLGNTLGGYVFYDEEFKNKIDNPRFVNLGEQTLKVFNDKKSKILEINSKTGLYPLYIVYSIYESICSTYGEEEIPFEQKLKIWDEVVMNSMFIICKTRMARFITKRTLVGYRNTQVRMHAYDDLIMQLRSKQTQFIKNVLNPHTWKLGGKCPMKFNAIVGNPPYQLMDGGNGSSSVPIYNHFVMSSINISPDYVSMIMPSRWFSGGKGLDDFRKYMLENKNIRILHDYMNSSECFNNANIEGGVCYFLYDKHNEGLCDYVLHQANGEIVSTKRYLKYNDKVDIVIRDTIQLSILNKIFAKDVKYLSEIVLTRNPFNISEIKEDLITNDMKFSLLRRNETKREVVGLKSLDFVTKNISIVDKYKVFVSKADGAAGQIGNPIPAKIIGNPEFGSKNQICTETFLAIGPFDKKEEADNLMKYLKTKFCRFMIGIRKNKNMTQDTYSYVPLMDFSIEWKDEDLYKYFELSQEEINYIEKMISSK